MRWILALVIGIVAAVGIGYGLAYLDKSGFYYIVAMPLIAGTLIGTLIRQPMNGVQISTKQLAAFAGVAALLMMGVYWYFLFGQYQDSIVKALQDINSTLTREDALVIIDKTNTELYGATGFPAFVMAYAATGFSIGQPGSAGGSQMFQGTTAYGLWVVEIIVAVGSAVVAIVRRKSAKASSAPLSAAPQT